MLIAQPFSCSTDYGLNRNLKSRKMNQHHALLRYTILLLLMVLTTNCTDNDDNFVMPELIGKNSDLYQLLNRVVESENEDPLEKIVCLDFVYPLELLVYNENLEVVDTRVITGDNNFSAFLGGLAIDLSISISYPITTTLGNGDVFTVNSNAELKLAIDSCSREDIITFCNGAFSGNPTNQITCVWNVKYDAVGDNRYVGGSFTIHPDGFLNFTYNQTTYLGSWTFVFVNNILNLNINLEGTTQVATDWNFNQRIYFVGNDIVIANSPKQITLMKVCETTDEYEIGENGPANGLVFYDKGVYTDGWRYMEVSNANFGLVEWGCVGSSIANASREEIGSGLANTAAVVNFHDDLNNYYSNPTICNVGNNGSVAAKSAISLDLGNSGWFLPSKEELEMVYTSLHLQGFGGFNGAYWSSSQIDSGNASSVNFDTGVTQSIQKNSNNIRAMAVRYF